MDEQLSALRLTVCALCYENLAPAARTTLVQQHALGRSRSQMVVGSNLITSWFVVAFAVLFEDIALFILPFHPIIK